MIGHVDMVGDDRIDGLVARDDAVVLPAVEAEEIDGWQINIGQESMPFRVGYGLYRTPSLAASGMPALLRHKFWLSPEKEQVQGLRFIGLLLFASERDDYRYTLQAGAELLGTVRPARRDNRRHLIVAERPIEILGGVPFTVRAEGTGPCYLEKLLFLSELPEASSFAPRLDRLSTRLTAAGTVVLHGIASEPVAVTAMAIPLGRAGAPVTATSGDYYPLLALPLPGLLPGQAYRIEVEAREPGGAVTRASVELPAAAPVAESGGTDLTVPIEVVDCGRDDSTGAASYGAVAPAGMPLTFAVPLPRGALREPAARVSFAGPAAEPGADPAAERDAEEAQVRVHARWPDGSARWALLDAGCPGGALPARGVVRLTRADAAAPAAAGDLTWSEEDGVVTAGNRHLRVTVRRGGGLFERLEVRRGAAWKTVGRGGGWHGALGSGLPLASQPVQEVRIEEAGPRRLVIRAEMPVADPRGAEHLRATVLVHLYAGQPFLTLAHRLVVVSPLAGAAMHGDLSHLGESGTATADLDAADLDGADHERASLVRVRSLELRLPWQPVQAAGIAGGETASPGPGAPVRVAHEHDRAYRVERGGEARTVDGHAAGRVTIHAEAGPCLLAVRDFWERYPKAVRCEPDAVAVELLPALGEVELPDYEREWHRLYFWLDRPSGCYRIKVGSALTTELMLCFADDVTCQTAAADWFQGHLAVRPDFDYVGGTGALEPLAAKHDSPHPPYERMVDRALAEWLEHRSTRHEVGFMNYGDTFKGSAESGGLWENNEYDAAWCHLTEFLRGGDPRWLPLGYEAARHTLDIDTCNHSRDRSQVGAQITHMAGHVGGYLPPFFRNKMAGSATLPSHMWVQGPVLYFLLTGDPFAAEVLEHTARWMTANLRYFSIGNARECGWQLTHLCALDRMGDDPRYLNAAAIIVEHILAAQSPGGGWERILTASHGGRRLPRPLGEAGFMVGVLLSALRRYHDLTGDPRVAEAITGGARWLVERTYDTGAGHFRYTSCAQGGGGPSAEWSLQVLEGLADANRIAPSAEVAAILRRNLADIGLTGEEVFGRPRVGKALTQEACYVPALLRALAHQETTPP